MSIDPQAAALLAQIQAMGGPQLHELPVPMAREAMRSLAAFQGEGEAVSHVADRAIPGPQGGIPVRIYTPQGRPPFPVLLYFHGGGWVIGDLDTHDPICRSLAKGGGCVVVSVDYRRAPEHKFPAAAEDCYAATVWAARHASEIGADPARLAVAGDSAGGNLAAVVALMARDRGEPRIVFQLLIYPVTDARFDTASYRENGEGYLLTREAMQWFWAHYTRDASDREHPYAAPLRAPQLGGLPPALIITAELDPLRDEGEAYGARLNEAGVAARVSRYDGMPHGFFGMAALLDKAREARDEAVASLRRAWG